MRDRTFVWDLPVRVFHWALAASFAGAYVLSESERLRNVHVMLGYTVLGLIAFRLLWGLVGTRYARFSSFAYGPHKAFAYLRSLASGRARDYTGHNPAGSWAVYAILILGVATGATGYMNFNELGGESLEEIHGALANAWMAVVVLHVLGVIASSLAHRENLVRAMLTGYKRGAGQAAEPVAARALGVAVAAAVLGFWGWSLLGGGSTGLAASASGAERGESVLAEEGESSDD